MKAIAYQHALPITDPLSLQDVDLPEPTPGARDLLVRPRLVLQAWLIEGPTGGGRYAKPLKL